MRALKAAMFQNDREYQAAKKQARKIDIGRRSGRRGTQAWGIWNEAE
jgi:hypothetical protein